MLLRKNRGLQHFYYACLQGILVVTDSTQEKSAQALFGYVLWAASELAQ